MTSFALDRAGKAYFLQTNGYLWHEGAPTYVANGVSSFKLDPAGKAYYLQTNGNLYHEGQGLVDVRAYAINLGADGSLVLDDWFSREPSSDGGLQTLARQDVMNRGVLTRQDLVGAGGIIARVEADGVVTAAERGGLLALSAGGATLGETAAVNYQLDIVARGAAAGGTAPLQSLVNRWFFGTDHPAGFPPGLPEGCPGRACGGRRSRHAGRAVLPPWSSFISYMDVNVWALGHGTFLAAFAAVAYRPRSPWPTTSPTTATGPTPSASSATARSSTRRSITNCPLTHRPAHLRRCRRRCAGPALLEKAFAWANQFGPGLTLQPGIDSYAALNGGNSTTSVEAMAALTGSAACYASSGVDVGKLVAAYRQGEPITLCTGDHPANAARCPTTATPWSGSGPWASRSRCTTRGGRWR